LAALKLDEAKEMCVTEMKLHEMCRYKTAACVGLQLTIQMNVRSRTRMRENIDKYVLFYEVLVDMAGS